MLAAASAHMHKIFEGKLRRQRMAKAAVPVGSEEEDSERGNEDVEEPEEEDTDERDKAEDEEEDDLDVQIVSGRNMKSADADIIRQMESILRG